MKAITKFLISLLIISNYCVAQLPDEQLLWPNGITNNPVKYKEEKLRKNEARKSSPSQLNRVFSCVSTPTYIIHRPEKGKSNGVAVVICPGGGFREVWFDREGNDLGLWLVQQGITSLVLKYRTFTTDDKDFKLKWDEYYPHVYSDAKQAIYILRSQAKELEIDENKIGIAGFSAGGMLSLTIALEINEKELPAYANFKQINTKPNFTGLFYPGLNQDLIKQAGKNDFIPPTFIMNGGQDNVTPAKNCIELYNVLTAKKIPVEIHIYAKGGHGFDSGIERGYGLSTWQDSFIAWLKDAGFIKE